MSLRSSGVHDKDEDMMQSRLVGSVVAGPAEKMAFVSRMAFDSSSSSMPTPTEMRTSCKNPEKAEKPRSWKKFVDLEDEESEAWRNIIQERFDRRTRGDCSKAHFFPCHVFRQTSFF